MLRSLVALVFVVACAVGCKRITADAQPVLVAVKNVDLPRAAVFDEMIVAVFTVEIRADGTLAANAEVVADERAITAKAIEATGKSPSVRAVIRANRSVTYERVIRVMDALKRGGISQIAFAVDVEK